MVTHQILVLTFKVRVLVAQHKRGGFSTSFFVFGVGYRMKFAANRSANIISILHPSSTTQRDFRAACQGVIDLA